MIQTGRLVADFSGPSDPSVAAGRRGCSTSIEARFSEKISLVDIARAVGRSPSHLTTVVREQTGMTVQQWIIERRMSEARQRLLLGNDENVEIVAERVGATATRPCSSATSNARTV